MSVSSIGIEATVQEELLAEAETVEGFDVLILKVVVRVIAFKEATLGELCGDKEATDDDEALDQELCEKRDDFDSIESSLATESLSKKWEDAEEAVVMPE